MVYTSIGPVHGVKTITLNGVSRTCAYDLNGNMVTSPDFTTATSPLNRAITYDADNMPTRIVHANGKTVDFVYDGVAKRTKKLVQSGKTVLYLGDHFEVENGVNIKYIFGGNLRLAQIKGSLTSSSISYFHKDHLGSTAAVTDETGQKKESTTYEPFGSTRTQEGTAVSSYKFTDQELDNETNLYNYDARLYDPVLGMFVTPDSIVPNMFDPQSLNRYNYCRNNPLIYVDPSGHSFGERPDGKTDRINDKPNSNDGTNAATPDGRNSWGGVLAPPTPPKGITIGAGVLAPPEAPKGKLPGGPVPGEPNYAGPNVPPTPNIPSNTEEAQVQVGPIVGPGCHITGAVLDANAAITTNVVNKAALSGAAKAAGVIGTGIVAGEEIYEGNYVHAAGTVAIGVAAIALAPETVGASLVVGALAIGAKLGYDALLDHFKIK